jgi:hypothetical protein
MWLGVEAEGVVNEARVTEEAEILGALEAGAGAGDVRAAVSARPEAGTGRPSAGGADRPPNPKRPPLRPEGR